MNTFNYPVPARKFLNNGGNIMQMPILLSNDANAETHVIVKRENNLLYLAIGEKIHIDMCWVLAKVVIE